MNWGPHKFNLGLDFPNLPYLVDGDFKLTESKSIMKYLCKKHNPAMLGRNAQEIATADMVSRVHDDYYNDLGPYMFAKGDCEEVQQKITKYSGNIEAFLNDKDFLIGD